MQRQLKLWIIAVAPVVFWLGSFVLAKTHTPLFIQLAKEDGLIENAQVFFFLADPK